VSLSGPTNQLAINARKMSAHSDQSPLADLAKALSHPLRVAMIRMLDRDVASPSELSKKLGTTVNNGTYHVRRLEELGAIEELSSRPVRGTTKHFFRAREDRYLNTIEVRLDRQGVEKLNGLLMKIGKEAALIESDAGARLQRNGDGGIVYRLAVFGYEE
jgi:DNA-binding transcriptional ArsR family regulator